MIVPYAPKSKKSKFEQKKEDKKKGKKKPTSDPAKKSAPAVAKKKAAPPMPNLGAIFGGGAPQGLPGGPMPGAQGSVSTI